MERGRDLARGNTEVVVGSDDGVTTTSSGRVPVAAKDDNDPIRLPSSLTNAGAGLFAYNVVRKVRRLLIMAGMQLIDRFKEHCTTEITHGL